MNDALGFELHQAAVQSRRHRGAHGTCVHAGRRYQPAAAKVGHRLDVPKSDELVRKGWHFWNRRTRGVSEAQAILEGLEQLRRTDYVDAFFMAVFREAVGQRDEAYGELER